MSGISTSSRSTARSNRRCATRSDPFDNVDLHFADAVELDLAAAAAGAGQGRGQPAVRRGRHGVLKSIEELPDAQLWVAMVQLEVGRRLAAAPGSKVYGATSVLAQLSCEVKVLRRISRNVFHPVPNVESGARAAHGAWPRRRITRVVELVHAAFAHRRKALPARSRSRAGTASAHRRRWSSSGIRADARAERLSPDDFRRLAEILSA